MWDALKGHKTYFVAALMIALGLMTQELQLVLEGLALAGLRHGMSTEMLKK